MPIFGLATDITDRLVQEHRDLLRLLATRHRIDVNTRLRPDPQPHDRDLAIHPHPTTSDPIVGLATRAQAQFGHALVQSNRRG